MTIPFSKRSALCVLALAAFSCHVHANQPTAMVGEPVERASPKASAESDVAQPGNSVRSSTSEAPSVAQVVAGATDAATTAAPIDRLSIQAGQRLSVVLGTWLKSQNIDLSWEPAGTLPGRVRDVIIESSWLASQTALEPTLTEVLAPFGLTAHVLRQGSSSSSSSTNAAGINPTSVVVRNASNARL